MIFARVIYPNTSIPSIRKQVPIQFQLEVSGDLPSRLTNTGNIIKLCPAAIFFLLTSLTRFTRPPDACGICPLNNVHLIGVKVRRPSYTKKKSVKN